MNTMVLTKGTPAPPNYTGIITWLNWGGIAIEKRWYLNGNLHRVDGPAIEYKDGDKEWWINGIWFGSIELTLKNLIILDKWVDSFGITFYEVLDEDGYKVALPDIPGLIIK